MNGMTIGGDVVWFVRSSRGIRSYGRAGELVREFEAKGRCLALCNDCRESLAARLPAADHLCP